MRTAQGTSPSAVMRFAQVTNNIENIQIQKYLILWKEKSYINFSFNLFSSNTKEGPSPCDFDITSLNYCNSARECPCGLEHCHPLQSGTLDGKGVCTPLIKACITDDDCTAVGDAHTMGIVPVECKKNIVTNKKECQYSGGILIA